MRLFATKLDDQEIEAVAAYYQLARALRLQPRRPQLPRSIDLMFRYQLRSSSRSPRSIGPLTA